MSLSLLKLNSMIDNESFIEHIRNVMHTAACWLHIPDACTHQAVGKPDGLDYFENNRSDAVVLVA